MRLYWSIRAVPELADLGEPDRRRIWRSCHRRGVAGWRGWLALSALLVWCVATALLGRHLSAAFFGGSFLVFFAAAIAGGAMGGLLYTPISIWLAYPYIRQEVPGYCPACGYNLARNVSGVCPECGEAALVS